MRTALVVATAALAGCAVAPTPYVVVPPPARVVYQVPPPQPVVSVYVEPPLIQPAPIRVAWAPPAMLVEVPPPMPYDDAIWIGGYWVWQGNWVWAHGRWAAPPRPGYAWVHPYYENRGDSVVFVSGFWAAPGVSFVAPSLSVNIAFAAVAAGVVAGPRPIGPEGVFIPPPPGSRAGLIVPAPIGTPPAVVTSAPPIVKEGMRITVNNTSVTNVHNVTNITNVTHITHVTIVAPPGTTANGHAVSSSVPVQAHLAAGLPPVVKAFAPTPASATPIPSYTPERGAVALPPAQAVHSEPPVALRHPHADDHALPAVPAASPSAAHGAPPSSGASGHAGGTSPTEPSSHTTISEQERHDKAARPNLGRQESVPAAVAPGVPGHPPGASAAATSPSPGSFRHPETPPRPPEEKQGAPRPQKPDADQAARRLERDQQQPRADRRPEQPETASKPEPKNQNQKAKDHPDKRPEPRMSKDGGEAKKSEEHDR